MIVVFIVIILVDLVVLIGVRQIVFDVIDWMNKEIKISYFSKDY